MFSQIKKLAIYLTVGLVPLFWLPFTVYYLEFNKVYLLVVLVVVGALAWLGEMIFERKELRFRRTPLDVYVLVFLGIMILSAVFSVDKWMSVLGFYGRFWPNIIGILSLGAFYFLLTNSAVIDQEKQDKQEGQERGVISGVSLASLLRIFLFSVGLIVITALLSVFGVWARIGGFLALPIVSFGFNMATTTLQGLSVWLATVLVFVVGLMAFKGFASPWQPSREEGDNKNVLTRLAKALPYYLLSLLILTFLAIVDFWGAWLIILVGMALLVGFALWKRIFRENVNRLSFSIVILMFAILFLLSNPVRGILLNFWGDWMTNIWQVNTTREALPSQKVSWQVALSGLIERPVIGSGPGTFNYVFSKHKPDSFLRSNLWSLRFDRPASHLTELIATGGVLTIVAWLVLLGMFCVVSWLVAVSSANLLSNAEKKYQGQHHLALFLPLFITVIAIIVAQFVYYQNVVLGLSFWLFLGLAVVAWQKPVKQKVYSLTDFPEIGLLFNISFWALVLTALFFGFSLVKLYWADVYYKAYLDNPSDQQNLQKLQRATQLAPHRAVYQIGLVRALLNRFYQEAGRAQPSQQVISNIVGATVQAALQVANAFPQRVAAQEVAGIVYRDIRGIADGASRAAEKRFAQALQLEPANPVLLTELGKLCAGENSTSTSTSTDEKEKSFKVTIGVEEPCAVGANQLFERALQLRPSYVDAAIQLASLRERRGDLDAAINGLKKFVTDNPTSVEGLFYLGRLFYNKKDYKEARNYFQQALQIFPNHSNSLYSLALVEERDGNIERAKQLLRRVLELNPGNKDVEAKLEQLERGGGKPEESIAPEGIVEEEGSVKESAGLSEQAGGSAEEETGKERRQEEEIPEKEGAAQ